MPSQGASRPTIGVSRAQKHADTTATKIIILDRIYQPTTKKVSGMGAEPERVISKRITASPPRLTTDRVGMQVELTASLSFQKMPSQACAQYISRIWIKNIKINNDMILLDNETDHAVDIEILERLAATLTDRDIELIVCNDETIADLNMQHRGISKATDVLSFPIDGNHQHLPLGTIVISYDTAALASKQHGHEPQDELALLFTHGMLHLLGYDHETDNGEMRSAEHKIIKQFGLPDSLIIRTEKA